MLYRDRVCLECGKGFKPGHGAARFCATACKTTWHRRRHDRGSELYDFAMAGAWDTVRSLVKAYQRSDALKRNGRQSFLSEHTAATRIPISGYGTKGDGR